MELGVYVTGGDNKGHTIPLPNPHRADMKEIVEKVSAVAKEHGMSIEDFDVLGLIPRMIKGVSGCEGGCPGSAQALVSHGHPGFDLEYVEGGILTAVTDDGKMSLKIFPDF